MRLLRLERTDRFALRLARALPEEDPMKTFETQVCVSAERVVTLKLPDDIMPGEHRVVVVIDEPAVAAPARSGLFNPEGVLAGLGVKLTLDDFQANRREIWGSSTDRELESNTAGGGGE
jgi:hypothetical protein